MIKEFRNISQEELQALYDEGFAVQEKLDNNQNNFTEEQKQRLREIGYVLFQS